MLISEPRKYRMSELEERTGLSERHIRFYIARDMVPGADQRGPNARYPQETLDRLLLIQKWKSERVAPYGRPLTLDEMRVTLANLDHDGVQLALVAENRFVDTEAPLTRSAQEARAPLSVNSLAFSTQSLEERVINSPELIHLLHRLADLLDEFASSSPVKHRRRAERWRRVEHDDLEIHVREPSEDADVRRMVHHARALRSLLENY